MRGDDSDAGVAAVQVSEEHAGEAEGLQVEQGSQEPGVPQADFDGGGLHRARHPPVAVPRAAAARARPQAHPGDGAVARALRLPERVLHVGRPGLRAPAAALGGRRHHARQRLHVHRRRAPPAAHAQQRRARAPPQQRLAALPARQEEQPQRGGVPSGELPAQPRHALLAQAGERLHAQLGDGARVPAGPRARAGLRAGRARLQRARVLHHPGGRLRVPALVQPRQHLQLLSVNELLQTFVIL